MTRYAKAQHRKYYDENSDRIRIYARKYRADNLERVNQRGREYKKNNPGKINANCAKRRAAKLQRTLPGFDEQIADIYAEASSRRAQGEDVHVDHIYPLQGETVSGLHVPSNLRIIPAIENLRKHNKMIEEACA